MYRLANLFKEVIISSNYDNIGRIILLIGAHSIDNTAKFAYAESKNECFQFNDMLNSITQFVEVLTTLLCTIHTFSLFEIEC